MGGSPNERRNYIFTAVLWGSAAMDEAENWADREWPLCRGCYVEGYDRVAYDRELGESKDCIEK